ncbi:MAG: hypothetical protein ACOZQL_21625 [Myxococcota bacterium]
MRRLLLCFALGLSACAPTEPAPSPPRAALKTALTIASTAGCRLDDDCEAQSFCFQARCVSECVSDAECPAGATCSARRRCVTASVDGGALDESVLGAAATTLGDVSFTGWPEGSVLEVLDGAPFVTLALRASAPVPGGRVLYSVSLKDGATTVARAEGSTDFVLELPTGRAGGDAPRVQPVTVVLPGATRELYLTPTRPVAGRYGGRFSPVVFGGGAGLPLDFVVQTEPERAPSLQQATRAWLWVPATTDAVVTLPSVDVEHEWVRSPLTWDADSGAWVAVFAEAVAADRLFGAGVFPLARRSLRFELRDFDRGTWRGAVADRWKGLFDQRSADGVREAGTATIAGTFQVERVGAVPAVALARDAVLDTGRPPRQPPPSLTDCTDADFQFGGGPDGGAPCATSGSAATFALASAPERSRCALAIADRVLSGPTLGKTLDALLDPATPDPVGVTFRSFIEDCASATSTTCKPTPALRCARAVVATAYLDADAASDDVQRLSGAYDRLTGEAFLGRQLAAFQVDTSTRLSWLQSSEAPPFLASTLRDYNQSILSTWRERVLEAHLSSLFGQLDAAGLAVLTRSPTDPAAQSTRRALLLELANSWRAALDGLVLLTTRQNVLLQDAQSRRAAAASIRLDASRLYVAAAILQVLSREAGSSALSSTFGAGFGNLQRELSRLSLPFDELLFARDAEVVTSRSVDPTQNARTLLSEREALARAAVRDATASVELVLAEAQQASVQEAELVARYEDQIVALRNELISLCGLPEGCTAADVGREPACDVPIQAGRCGFVVDRAGALSQTPSTSEAGNTLLSFQEATFALLEAGQRRDARAQQASLIGATADGFAAQVQRWQDQRTAVNAEVGQLLDEIGALNDEVIQAQIDSIRQQRVLREANYARQQAALVQWDGIRLAGIASDVKKLRQIDALNISASIIGDSADRIDLLAAILVDGQPKLVGLVNDVGAPFRLLTRLQAYIASSVLLAAGRSLEAASVSMETDLESARLLREAQLTTLEQLPDLDAVGTENDLAALQDIIDTSNLVTERQIRELNALIEAKRRELELNLAHERDLQELRDRRDQWRLALIDAAQLDYAVRQAEVTVRQRELAYAQVVQRAQLLEGRYRSMLQRYGSLQALLGSPDVLFSFAARMARAESRIDRARTALEEWLVALEYYAVRPFVDQRLAILLARNPSQLEAIANEFLRLQRACGGPVTVETVELSLRDDLLGMGFDTASSTGPERLRALLARAETPINPRTPFSATQTIGERLASGRAWAASFPLSISSFANLGQSCNAKLESVAVQLVGAGFHGQPVVSLVYDGGGQLRSCQPDILPLVQALGPGRTAFSEVTSFKTAGRTVNPLAGLGTFGPRSTWNATLEGLPLAAGYTVVIDRDHPSNADQPWEQLEDVKLQLRYSYQDVFPEGQCQ